MNAELTAKIGIAKTRLSSISNLTEDQKLELHSRGQDIISKAQVQDLHKIMNLLDTVLADRQKQYYIIIGGKNQIQINNGTYPNGKRFYTSKKC